MKFIKGLSKNEMINNVLGIFIVSRLLVLSAGYLSRLIINKGKFFVKCNVISIYDLLFKWRSGFVTWDCAWYLSIVKKGYSYTPGKQSNVAFFPLYPTLIKTFSFMFKDPKIIGYLISNIALFFAAFYLYKLVKLEFQDSKVATKTVFFMLISPVSFFFSIIYSEGLFLFLAISSFYYIRKKRWLLASILGFFLSMTRLVGVVIIIPFIIEYLDIKLNPLKINFGNLKKDILYLLFIPAGLCSYMVYLYFKFGDAFAFYNNSLLWHRKFASIFTTLRSISIYGHFYKIIFLGAVILALLIIGYLIYAKIRLSYIIYSALLLFIYLSSNRLGSIPRFIGVVFPLYLGTALIANKHKFCDYLLTLFSIMLLTLFTILFVNGYYFV